MNEQREATVRQLEEKAREIRAHIVRMATATACHTGGALSMTDIIAALYFHVLRVNPENPGWDGRDYFILSKGHTVPALAAALAMRGFFAEDLLARHQELDSIISGHACTTTPGVDVSTGSLGHGLPIGVGIALGIRADEAPNRVFVILGDGELQEGSNWEAAMSAAHHKLANLTAIVDRNWHQTGPTEDMLALEPLADKWASFGWGTQVIDGNDMGAVLDVLESIPHEPGRPTAIVAHTVKGKGVSQVEDGHKHMSGFTPEERDAALKELGMPAGEAGDA
ncbi:MAG: transketolase [Armatimonadota bacterium]|jgi:transketolase